MDRQEISACIERMSAPGPPRLKVLGRPPQDDRRIGMVPGSFDPMTVAHAALAEALDVDAVMLVWSPATLPKETPEGGAPEPSLLDPVTRIESMLAYAASRPTMGVAVGSHGLYVDQAEACGRLFPGGRPVIALGSDKVMQLLDHAWYDDRDAALERLFAAADVAYAVRRGDEARLARLPASEPRWAGLLRRIDVPPDVSAVSSSDVRRRIRRGEDPAAWVPAEVLQYL